MGGKRTTRCNVSLRKTERESVRRSANSNPPGRYAKDRKYVKAKTSSDKDAASLIYSLRRSEKA